MRKIWYRDTIYYYYGSLLYYYISFKPQTHLRYGEGVIYIYLTVQYFCKWAAKLHQRFHPFSRHSISVLMVPTPFCVRSFINYPRYLRCDK